MGVRSTGSQHPTTTEADGHLLEYFRQNFGAGGGANAGPTSEIEMIATGGVVADYESGGTQYRTHTFTTSGTFQITQNSSGFSDAAKIDVFLIAGGGAGGGSNATYGGGGGGAGGAIEVTAYQLILPHIQSLLEVVDRVERVVNHRITQLQELTEMIQHLLIHLQKF